MFNLLPIRRADNYTCDPVLNRLFDEPFSRFFETLDVRSNDWTPSVELTESGSEILFTFEVPGIDQEHLKISIEDGVLTVSGERSRTQPDDKSYLRSERRYGKFSRSFRLPESVNSEKVSAALKDGLLTISVAKQEKAKPKEVKVQIV